MISKSNYHIYHNIIIIQWEKEIRHITIMDKKSRDQASIIYITKKKKKQSSYKNNNWLM